MVEGRLTFPSKEPMRGQYVVSMAKLYDYAY